MVSMALREFLERETDFDLEQKPPTRSHVIKTVLELKPAIIERDVVSISLFGSVSHGDAWPDSDIDFIIDPTPDKTFSITPVIAIERLLEARFDRAVDVITRRNLGSRKSFCENVTVEAVRIF